MKESGRRCKIPMIGTGNVELIRQRFMAAFDLAA
jgi:hypothetical protein